MVRAKTQKIDVTIKPWWQTQLFGALVGALVAGLFSVIPWYYSLKNENWIQEEIDRKVKMIQNDNFGLSILGNSYGNAKWNFDGSDKIKMRIESSVWGKRDSWIGLHDPITNKDVKYGRAVRDGVFSVVIGGLNCGYTYPYRPEAIHDGRVVFGPLGQIVAPNCGVMSERAKAVNHPSYSPDF